MSGPALDQVSYTPKQAAEQSGLSEYTVYAAIRSGDLRATQPEINGRRIARYVILRDDLVAWLSGGDQ